MKVILIILALAAYGAYSLFGSAPLTPSPSVLSKLDEKPAASAAEGVLSRFGLPSAADLAANAATTVTGLQVDELPTTGCSYSALSPSQVLDMLNTLPDAQRAAVAKLLDVSSTVWSAQLYTGEDGVGLCLPNKGKLVRLPGVTAPGFTVSPESVTDLIRSAGNVVSGALIK